MTEFVKHRVHKEFYPKVYQALWLVYADNMPGQIRENKEYFDIETNYARIHKAEQELSQLSPEQMETFCSGEETEIETLRDNLGLHTAHQMLLDFFEMGMESQEEVGKRVEKYFDRLKG